MTSFTTGSATLTEALDAVADDGHQVIHVKSEDESRPVSVGELRERALRLLGHFQAAGLERGDELILFLDDTEHFVDAFWAALYGGIVAVPVAFGAHAEHRRKLYRVFDKLDQPRVCTTTRIVSRVARYADSDESMHTMERIRSRCVYLDKLEAVEVAGKVSPVTSDYTAFIQFSSGSTSEPKGVVLSHGNLLANIDAIHAGVALRSDDSTLSWMPLTHDMGLIGFHLGPIVGGIDQYLLAPELFIRRPALWLKLASDKSVTITCSPNFGYRHFLKYHRPDAAAELDLSKLRIVFNGAEPISATLSEEFTATLSAHGLPKTAMFPVYGLAEASLAVTFPSPGSRVVSITVDRHQLGVGDEAKPCDAGADHALTFVKVGRPVRHCEVRIVDDAGDPLDAGRVGHIEIRGANVCQGFRAGAAKMDLPFTKDGWLDTGDLGFFHDNELVVTGRAKDLILYNGQNYYPNDLEDVATDSGLVDAGKVAAGGASNEDTATDDILLFVQHRGDVADFVPTAKDLSTYVAGHTGLEVAKIIPVKQIPRTTSGKLQRHALLDAYVNGEFDAELAVLEEMLGSGPAEDPAAFDEIERQLKEICDRYIKHKNVGLHDNFFEIGENSLTLAMVFEEIDEKWPGHVDLLDLFDYPTIADLATFVKGKLEAEST